MGLEAFRCVDKHLLVEKWPDGVRMRRTRNLKEESISFSSATMLNVYHVRKVFDFDRKKPRLFFRVQLGSPQLK